MKKRVISKEYLLEIAHTIALEQGPESLSIRNVAKKANVSIGSVYNYFESKEDLTKNLITNIWEIYYQSILNECTGIKSYTRFLDIAYASLYNLTQDMYSIFDFHLKNSSEAERASAFEFHNHQIKTLNTLFHSMMKDDPNIRKDTWSEDFKEESFNLFVVKNYFTAIKNSEPNVNFLIKLVEKIIY